MSWAGNQHPVEAAIEWLSPIPLGLAVGWASARLGFASIESMALGGAALAAGFAAFTLAGGSSAPPIHDFQPAEFESADSGELLLEEKDAVLELDDPLEVPTADSRVVHLFERQDPTPGELVDRIVGFLAEGKRETAQDRLPAEPSRVHDASAALHDALANIRASLR